MSNNFLHLDNDNIFVVQTKKKTSYFIVSQNCKPPVKYLFIKNNKNKEEQQELFSSGDYVGQGSGRTSGGL